VIATESIPRNHLPEQQLVKLAAAIASSWLLGAFADRRLDHRREWRKNLSLPLSGRPRCGKFARSSYRRRVSFLPLHSKNIPADVEMLRAVEFTLVTTGGKLIVLSGHTGQSGALGGSYSSLRSSIAGSSHGM
jgi:hypothetical protein